MSEQDNNGSKTKTVAEELEVAGSQLVDRVKQIIKEGNARRLIIRSGEGKVLFDTPLTMGAGLGGALTLLGGFPIVVVAGIAAAFARVRIEVVREVREGDIVETSGEVKVHVEDAE